MARKDRLDELIAIKKRSGRRGGRVPDEWDLKQLTAAWLTFKEPKELLASLLPARLVTLLEVFSRGWIEKLIDHGSPYSERAIDLKVNIKYDLPLVRSLHGQTISVGFLISHNLPLSSIDSIASIFTILLDTSFFPWLAKVKTRRALEVSDAPPVVEDIEKLTRMISRLFDIRHILVHELPQESSTLADEIQEMIGAAEMFIEAADEGLTQLIFGLYPITQVEMNAAARHESEQAAAEIEKVVDEIAKKHGDTIREVQRAWKVFADAEANRSAEIFTGGTAYPLAYYAALKDISTDRLKQLRTWLEDTLVD